MFDGYAKKLVFSWKCQKYSSASTIYDVDQFHSHLSQLYQLEEQLLTPSRLGSIRIIILTN